MTTEEYYSPIPQDQFDEIKNRSIVIWKNLHSGSIGGYLEEKLERIESAKNDGGQWMIVQMFDYTHKRMLLRMVSKPTRELIIDALNLESIL